MLFRSGEHCTARLFQVRAVTKAALADIWPEFPECILQILARDGVDHIHLKGREARRVGNKRVLAESIELNVARRMLAAAEPLADGAGRNAERCVERIEQTRFADAGVTGEGAGHKYGSAEGLKGGALKD